MCCVYPVWKVLGPVGSWRAQRNPWGPFNRNHTGADNSHLLRWDHRNPLWKCENLQKNTQQHSLIHRTWQYAKKKKLPQSCVRAWMWASLLWYRTNELSHTLLSPTEPVALDSTGQPLWRTVWCPRPSMKQEVSWEVQDISLLGWDVSQAEHHHCLRRSLVLCDSLAEHVFLVRSSWV